ncbi:hypothetical protein BC1_00033 [Bacillus phage BC-1]|nr:hypothetical protein BC1_00033 [Bacillus phage BC-1]
MLGNAIEITISEEQLKPLVDAEVKRIIEEKRRSWHNLEYGKIV